MNRRGFLGSLFAGAAALALPALGWAAKVVPIPRGLVAWKMSTTAAALNDAWVCIIHPDCARDLIDMQARDKWKVAYQRARVDKFSGSPSEILARYKPAILKGELGTIGGVRWKVMGAVPKYN